MKKLIDRIVAGVATMTEMDPIIPAAAGLAARSGLPLELVHAFEVSDPFVDTYLRFSPLPGDHLQHYCEGLQARLEGQVGGLPGEHTDVRCRAVPGTAPAALKEAAGPGSLLVVGPTRRWRSTAALLGTTAQRVLHDAANPVLVLRDELHLPPRVLFCVDLSWAGSRQMVDEGLAVLHAICGDQPPEIRFLVVVRLEMELPLAGMNAELEGAATDRLSQFIRELGPIGTVQQRVRIGAPGNEVVAEAAEWKSDLIVVGTHGRTGLARALLGSVAEVVIRDAHCSVLVVPPAAAGPTGDS
jgi:universal stress protein E